MVIALSVLTRELNYPGMLVKDKGNLANIILAYQESLHIIGFAATSGMV